MPRTDASIPGHSITRLLHVMRSEDRCAFDQAAARVWSRYSAQLLKLVKQQLSGRIRIRSDEDDVLQSAYKSFCLRQRHRHFDLRDRGDLWTLLVTMALNKARTASVRERRQKRDYRREHVDREPDQPGSGGGASALDRVAAPQPTPDEALAMEEVLELRLSGLPEGLRSLAMLKLAGYSNEQVAAPEMLDCSVRTVERKLSLIRKRWADVEDEQASGGASG